MFRSNFRLRYRIERHRAGYVKLLTSMIYEVVNPTDEPQKYSIDVGYEDAFPEVGQAKILSVGAQGSGMTPCFNLSAAEIHDQTRPEGPLLSLAKTLVIRPKSGPNIAWVDLESYEEENGGDTFFFSYPTVNVTVTVDAPEDFELEVYFGHRFQQGEHSRISKVPPPPERTHTWQMTGAMLMWHCVSIEWKGKNVAEPNPPDTVAPAEMATAPTGGGGAVAS